MGNKSWRETLGTIGVKSEVTSGQHFENLTHGRTSKGPNPGFGRTPVKSTNWSHDGQKDGFVIFARGAPKMCKKSWKETTGVKVRSEILSPGQNLLF